MGSAACSSGHRQSQYILQNPTQTQRPRRAPQNRQQKPSTFTSHKVKQLVLGSCMIMKHGFSSSDCFLGAVFKTFISQGLKLRQWKEIEKSLTHSKSFKTRSYPQKNLKPVPSDAGFPVCQEKGNPLQSGLLEGEVWQTAGLYLSWTAVKVF